MSAPTPFPTHPSPEPPLAPATGVNRRGCETSGRGRPGIARYRRVPGRRLLACYLALASAVTPAAMPAPFTARYALVQHGVTVGEMEWRFTHPDSERYRFESHSRTTGLAALLHRVTTRESSDGRFDPQRFVPLAYRYEQSDDPAAAVRLDFTDDERRIAAVDGGQAQVLELPDDRHDKLSYVLQMMHDLADPEAPLGYTVVEGHRVKTYRFERLAPTTIETTLGRLPVVAVQRESKSTTTFWCAPDYGYLPVRIVTRKGDARQSELKLLETSLPRSSTDPTAASPTWPPLRGASTRERP